MAYTSFALLAASIMVAMAFNSVNTVDNQPVQPEQLKIVEKSWAETQGNYAVDSLDEYTQIYSGIVTESELNKALQNLTETGVYNSNRARKYTYTNWSKEVETESNRITETSLKGLNASVENLSVITESQFSVETYSKSRTFEIQHSEKLEGVEDPLLDDTTYAREIDACYFESLADKLYDVSSSSGTVRGPNVLEPSDASSISSSGSKILVTNNVSSYNQSDVQNFLGYFSEHSPSNPGNYNSNYAAGASNTPQLDDGQNVIIHSGFWESNFEEAIDSGCYMPSPLQNTPSVLDRLNENTRGGTNQGLYTVLTPNTSQSDIGYERLDGSGLSLVEIETVSESGAYPGFNMSMELADSTGLNGLIK